MANPKQLNRLMEGIGSWNQWRDNHPNTQIDLSGADLSNNDLKRAYLNFANLSGVNLNFSNLRDADLSNANLCQADLNHVHLNFANLSKADLSDAHINFADLGKADLSYANLSHTYLNETDLRSANLIYTYLDHTYLRGADLRGADLRGADFRNAYLDNIHLSRATVAHTVFAGIDLRGAKGLDTINHQGPSHISIDTIYLSQGNVPEVFLKGAGIDDTFISYIRSLTNTPIQYYSCFISYSTQDEPFAQRLYADLQSHNVRCWFAPHDMRTGDRIRDRIDESIRLYEKLLIILSQASVESRWVEHEVETALDKEREGHPNILFPVRIDQTIMSKKIGWANHIRTTRHIGDFTHWKEHDAYQVAFTHLLRDLQAQSSR